MEPSLEVYHAPCGGCGTKDLKMQGSTTVFRANLSTILATAGIDGQHSGSTYDVVKHMQSAAIRFLVVGGHAGEQPHLSAYPGSKRAAKSSTAPCGPVCRVKWSGPHSSTKELLFLLGSSTNSSAELQQRT